MGREKATEQHKERNYKGFFNPFAGTHDYDTLFENFIQLGAQYIAPYKIARHHAKFYNHMPAELVRARIPKHIWNTYYKFCIERDYLDKTISHFYHMKKRYNRYFDKDITFEEYIHEGTFCLNYPQYTDYNGNVMVDYIAKYENLSDELSMIFDKLHIPFEGTLGVRAKGKTRKDKRPASAFFSGENEKFIPVLKKAFKKEIQILEEQK